MSTLQAWRAAPWTYRRALVRRVPSSFAASALRRGDGAAAVVIDQARVLLQHERYVAALRALVPEVIELDGDSAFPDSCFVEDTAVVVGKTALLTRPGHESRVGEVSEVSRALSRLHYHIVRADATPGALLDGGDVLFTGREFFVGVGGRSNLAGAAAVRNAFPSIPVTPIYLSTGTVKADDERGRRRAAAKPSAPAPTPLHLKSVASMCGPDSVAVCSNEVGLRVASQLQLLSKADAKRHPLTFVVVPDPLAANTLFVNGALIHAAASSFPESASIFAQFQGEGKRVEIDASELAKADGALTCCSVLLH